MDIELRDPGVSFNISLASGGPGPVARTVNMFAFLGSNAADVDGAANRTDVATGFNFADVIVDN